MNTADVPEGQTVISMENRYADGICGKSDERQNRSVSYEYEGYQVCVHFDGNKTLKQCIQSLAERKFGG